MSISDPGSDKRVLKAIGLAVVAPGAVYYLLYHHFSAHTQGEQITIGVLAFCGLAAAVKWA